MYCIQKETIMGNILGESPPLDLKGGQAVTLANLNEHDVGMFFAEFQKLDKDLRGKIHYNDLMEYLEEPKSLFSDAIFELCEIPLQGGVMTFGQFLYLSCTFCLMEVLQLEQFIFFIFDKDKNGYIKHEDLEVYVKTINSLELDQEFRANQNTAWQVLQTELNKDGKVDFKEFQLFNAEWPALFYPAFRLNTSFIEKIMGEKYWMKKKRQLQDVKDKKRREQEKKKQRALAKAERIRQRKIRKKMGTLYYYLCPCLREHWDKLFPPPENNEISDAEKKKRMRDALENQKRQEDIDQKNQLSLEYMKFKEKKQLLLEQWEKQKVVPKRVYKERKERVSNRRDRFKGKLDF